MDSSLELVVEAPATSTDTANAPVKIADLLDYNTMMNTVMTGDESISWRADAVETSPFGMRNHPLYGGWRMHNGVDIAPTNGGNPMLYSAHGGVVVHAQYTGGYGYMVIVATDVVMPDGSVKTLETFYAHLHSMNVGVGDVIGRGTILGKLGTTGGSTGPHLHFETRVDDKPYDPKTISSVLAGASSDGFNFADVEFSEGITQEEVRGELLRIYGEEGVAELEALLAYLATEEQLKFQRGDNQGEEGDAGPIEIHHRDPSTGEDVVIKLSDFTSQNQEELSSKLENVARGFIRDRFRREIEEFNEFIDAVGEAYLKQLKIDAGTSHEDAAREVTEAANEVKLFSHFKAPAPAPTYA